MRTHAKFTSNPLVIAGAILSPSALTSTLPALGGTGSLSDQYSVKKGMILNRDYAKPAEDMPLTGMTLPESSIAHVGLG